MKTFTIENKLRSAEYDSTSLRRSFIGFLWGIFICISFIQSELNYSALAFCVAYTIGHFYIKPSQKSSNYPFGITTLEFGKENLIYKNENSIIWHIPYSRLEKIQFVYHGKGNFLSPKIKEILVLTNDNDSYSIIGDLPESEMQNIQNEIEIVKSYNKAVKPRSASLHWTEFK